MSIFNKKTTNFAFFSEAKRPQKVEKMSKKVKISRKICEKIVLSLRMISSFLCHTTQGNHEK